MDLGLKNRRALVLGASSGLGRACAAGLVEEGALVAVASRSQERVDQAAAEIGAAAALAFDVSDLDGVPAFVARVEAALGGPLDVLICNCGGPPTGPDALAFTRDEWIEAHRQLVLAPVAFLEAVVPGMRERRWGRVVNIVSTTAKEPNPAIVLSNSHRAAALATFKTVASQVAADGVTINSALPGFMGTDRLTKTLGSPENIAAAVESRVPADRVGTPEEFAAAVLFYCSAGASYVTGTTLAVDGGLSRAT